MPYRVNSHGSRVEETSSSGEAGFADAEEITSKKRQMDEAGTSSQQAAFGATAHKRPRCTQGTVHNPRTVPPPYEPHTMWPPKLAGGTAFTILSWNVRSITSLLAKPDILKQLQQEEAPDVFCLQETKLQKQDTQKTGQRLQLPGWHMHWSCSQNPARLGYALETNCDMEHEGRTITTEFERFYIVSTYFPNSGHAFERLKPRLEQWDVAFRTHVKRLEKRKHVIVMGDLNCTLSELDIHPIEDKRVPSNTKEERESLWVLLESGLTDTFRQQYSDLTGYTYWKARFRTKNFGWRLDYALVSDGLVGKVYETFHRPDVMGSDHCPIGITLLHA